MDENEKREAPVDPIAALIAAAQPDRSDALIAAMHQEESPVILKEMQARLDQMNGEARRDA